MLKEIKVLFGVFLLVTCNEAYTVALGVVTAMADALALGVACHDNDSNFIL